MEGLETPPLFLAHALSSCRVLGPGNRGVLWVRGCSRRCRGCIATPILDAAAVSDGTTISALAARILSWPNIDGLTLSGGEPFEQAAALFALCSQLRAQQDLSLMCYSGFTLVELRASADAATRGLLGLLDILVDGPFVQEEQADLLWRGSSNQRIHLLSDRHRDLAASLEAPGAGVEVHVRPDASVFWAGVPPPGFERRLSEGLKRRGILLQHREGFWV